jgi:hypothetical protein
LTFDGNVRKTREGDSETNKIRKKNNSIKKVGEKKEVRLNHENEFSSSLSISHPLYLSLSAPVLLCFKHAVFKS